MPEWFEEWFGEEYLELYPHRDDSEAERAVRLIASATGLGAGWRVLDVGDGNDLDAIEVPAGMRLRLKREDAGRLELVLEAERA